VSEHGNGEADDATNLLTGASISAIIAFATAPMGAVGAAVGTFTATVVTGALSGRRQLGLENVEDTLASACQRAGMSPVELDVWTQEPDRRLLLTCAVVQAAFTTLDATKLTALSRAYATGLEDDAKVDQTRLIVACLVDLEPVHLQVLKTMILEANPHNENVPALNEGTTILSSRQWEWRDLSAALPHIDPLVLINVLGTLQRHGLIAPVLRQASMWTPTGFAIPCMNYLAERPAGPQRA
jgi:hypothetical protein